MMGDSQWQRRFSTRNGSLSRSGLRGAWPSFRRRSTGSGKKSAWLRPRFPNRLRGPANLLRVTRPRWTSSQGCKAVSVGGPTLPDDTRRALPQPVTPGVANSICGRFLAQCAHATRGKDHLRRDAGFRRLPRPCLLQRLPVQPLQPLSADPRPDHVRPSDIEPRVRPKGRRRNGSDTAWSALRWTYTATSFPGCRRDRRDRRSGAHRRPR
jgi:hypothetical protein